MDSTPEVIYDEDCPPNTVYGINPDTTLIIPGMEEFVQGLQDQADIESGQMEVPDHVYEDVTEEQLDAILASNKDRIARMAQTYGTGPDPIILMQNLIMTLADMMLTKEGMRVFVYRQEEFVARLLDILEEEIPKAKARQELMGGLNRAQRRAMEKAQRKNG